MAPKNHKKQLISYTAGITLTVGALVSLIPASSVSASTSNQTKAVVSQKASNTTSSPARLPRFGDKGDTVIAVQRALMNNGFTLRGGATGVFDANTRTTLRNFQKVVGLKVTGRVDAATARVLKLNVASTTAPTASFPFTITTLPKRGDNGDAVVAIQSAIKKAGTTVRGGVDGVFGLGTTRSIEDFQRAKGLTVTGLLDPATAAALGLIEAQQPAPAQASTATSPAFTLTTMPKRGERGDKVRVLQQTLIASGIAIRGGADGVYGSFTTTAIKRFQRQNGLPVTGSLNAQTAYKMGLVAAPAMQLAVFPVQGPCSFIDTWHEARGGGRLHIGVDIIAPRGNLVYAVADGTITRTYVEGRDKLSGNGVRLTMADGTYFFYGHFDAIAPGIQVGSVVKAGQVIGTIGSTGNTSTPHLHLEIHPGGGDAINPFPIVKAIDACNVRTPRPAPAQ
jgi:peptidoglycan hydrolase-like protein with peptidoglycan-binding domain